MKEHIFTVDCLDDVNKRMDVYLSEKIDYISRSYAQKLLADCLVFVNDKAVKSNYKIKKGDNIKATIPEPQKLNVLAEDIELDVIYEDNDIIVINKPQDMVVHPAAGNYTGTLVNALLSHCGNSLSQINGIIRPGIVHRIDKDTSGILVIAKNNESHISLAEQIKEHSIKRKYHAIVYGNIKEDKGSISTLIGRHPVDRKRMAVVERGKGREAITHFEVLERFGNYTYIELTLETGRTHQIRVHMCHINHPILGDPVYGPKKCDFKLKGQVLHAKILGFIHPVNKEYMEFSAPLPEYFEKIIKILRER